MARSGPGGNGCPHLLYQRPVRLLRSFGFFLAATGLYPSTITVGVFSSFTFLARSVALQHPPDGTPHPSG